MQKNILITGKPKSGKSTLLRKLISPIPNKVGFLTNEILKEGVRTGFEIETHTGRKATLADVTLESPNKVSKYFVHIENLEPLIPDVSRFTNNDILYLDEIGQMQLFSKSFQHLVLRYLDSQNICIATLSYIFENDFTKLIKKRDDVMIVELSAENREEQEQFILELLKKIDTFSPF